MTLDTSRIRAITLDLDDTLWPVWPTIARAEQVLRDWLAQRAPRTAALLADAVTRQELRDTVAREFAHQAHDLSLLRRESIRAALRRAADDEALTDAAFDAFFAERQRVTLYDDALPALRKLSARYPLVAISNGNADLDRTGMAPWFRTGFSARSFGSGKPHAPIFHAAAAALGVEPGQVLHVGDDAALDVAGALNAGMQAVWLAREGQAWGEEGAPPQLIVRDLHALCAALALD
jgi:2-haloalkanoic acid dehalogenase type II